jgi:hypothetical protein
MISRTAPGYYAWESATTRSRQMFCREGWEKGEENGIETIVNHDLKKKVAILNTDLGTCDQNRSPRNRTLKGPAQDRVIDLNSQYELFKIHEITSFKSPPYSLWYLCIFDDGKKVRSEISRPSEYSSGYIVKFSERIFILQDGEWEKVLLAKPPREGPPLEIVVRRK